MTPIVGAFWCVRAQLPPAYKYHGAYPKGFLEKARVFMGVHITDPVLHVCGGMVRHYPNGRGFGPNDKTLDLNPATEPDYLQDAREPYPLGFKAIMIDTDYTPEDAEQRPFPMARSMLPRPRLVLQLALDALEPGRRVGMLHLISPRPPKDAALFLVSFTVKMGFDNRDRVFSVYEKR